MLCQRDCRILSKKEISSGIFDFTVSTGSIALDAAAGQFVHISAPGFFLRRPISICEIDRIRETLRLVIQVRGGGTDSICGLNAGDSMNILGPLGKGFTVDENYKRVVLIGGGIGTPPMIELAKSYGEKAVAITGFRTSSLSILSDDFKSAGARLVECSDDGSVGRKGFVTDTLAELLKEGGVDMIYACGPMPMLKGVAEAAINHGVSCELSLEERMACGVGACLGCAVKLKSGDREYNGHVCKDGPVFDAREVIF